MVHKTGKKYLKFMGLAIAVTLVVGGASFRIRKVSAQSPSHKVVAYYFHTNTRCDTCRKIEAYSHEAIEEGFKTELKLT